MGKSSFFREEDVATTEAAVRDWQKKYPEAAMALQVIYKAQLMVAGHKTMGRVILNYTKE